MNEDEPAISRRHFLLTATGIIGSRLFFGGRNCNAKASQSCGHLEAICSEVNGLDPRFTFDTFAIHRDNRSAFAVARAVAEKPGTGFNLLYIYGRHGTGKTHLMQAIGNRAASSRLKVIYVSAKHFGNDFIEAIKNGSLVRFRKRYKQADLVLVDGVLRCAKILDHGTKEISDNDYRDQKAIHSRIQSAGRRVGCHR
jgi:chromosomal replication initiation ATPase DnaA